jgi:hypothetical protein
LPPGHRRAETAADDDVEGSEDPWSSEPDPSNNEEQARGAPDPKIGAEGDIPVGYRIQLCRMLEAELA